MAARLDDLDRIQRGGILILTLSVFVSLCINRADLISGLLLGGLVSLVNFRLITRIVNLSLAGVASQAGIALRLGSKFLGLVAIVCFVLLWLPTEPIAFIAGMSVTFFSIGLSTSFQFLKRTPANPEQTDA